MNQSPDLPTLKIVPTKGLHPHELPDEQRAKPLVEVLRRDRVLKNPPIVLPLNGKSEDYVVLDGANRVTALRLLGVPHSLVQVVHRDEGSVRLRTWNHVLLEKEPHEVEERLRSVEALQFRPSDFSRAMAALEKGDSLVNFIVRSGSVYQTGVHDGTLQTRIQALSELVDAYHGTIHFERTSAERLEALTGLYERPACLVLFPEFTAREVVEGVANRWHFPPGITRFIVSPRALRLNYPLEMLDGEASTEEKNKWLRMWVRERMRNRRVRYYAESTFLFDE